MDAFERFARAIDQRRMNRQMCNRLMLVWLYRPWLVKAMASYSGVPRPLADSGSRLRFQKEAVVSFERAPREILEYKYS